MGSTSTENNQLTEQSYAGPHFHGSWCANSAWSLARNGIFGDRLCSSRSAAAKLKESYPNDCRAGFCRSTINLICRGHARGFWTFCELVLKQRAQQNLAMRSAQPFSSMAINSKGWFPVFSGRYSKGSK